ncbi:MAG: RNA polymerase sigma factor [Gammaproteobacteria bacterium]
MNPLGFVHTVGTFAATLGDRRKRMMRVARAWCGNASLAEDLVQETFAKALKRLGQLRDPTAIDAWLFQIMTNCWRDYYRRQRPADDIDALAEHDDLSADGSFDADEIVARVRAAIDELPIGQREVLALIDLEGFSYAEVAKLLNVPQGTVTSRVCRARETLRELLLDLGTEDTTHVVPIRRIK